MLFFSSKDIRLVKACTFLRLGHSLLAEVEYLMLIDFKLINAIF